MGEVFVAGIAARLPQSENIDVFWENLMKGNDMIGQTRWPKELYGTPPRVGLIKNLDKFDADYFNFEETEVHHMNPMLRHLLEVCAECIVDSSLCPPLLQNNSTGLYLACFLPDNDPLETSRGANSRLCTTVPTLAGHLMEHFGLSGPMLTVDTGCSSSLSAMEMAVNDLRAGKCQFALVTAVNLLLNPSYLQQMSQLGMLNPTGQSNVFDAKAGGYVRAEGVVSILLTRNESICKRVYLSIVDIMTNCDGFKSEGITFPNSQSQADLMSKIYNRCKIDVNSISYVEAHSTGTKAGDPVEVTGICEALCKNRQKPLLIGSVKGSMGHSEATAGFASFVKCVLIARHGTIPPQINFQSPNPNIKGIVEGKVKVVDKATTLEDGYISLNSFGYGGANGHLVLKPYRNHCSNQATSHKLVTIKARNELEMETIVEFVRKNKNDAAALALLSHSLLSHDPKRKVRGYVVTESGPNDEDVHKVSNNLSVIPSIWLILRDVAWGKLDLSSSLMDIPVFMKSVQHSQQILSKIDDTLPWEDFYRGELCTENVHQGTVFSIIILIGIVDIMRETKLQIQGVVGCGLSEIVAAYQDGCLSREQCVGLAYLIGKLLKEFSNLGKTQSVYRVTLDPDEIYCLGPFTRVLSAVSQDTFVIVVETSNKEEVLRTIHSKGGYYTELPGRLALYSDLMTEIVDGLEREAREILHSPKYRSKNMISLSQDYAIGCQSSVSSLFDWDYLRRVLTTPATVTSVLNTLPVDTTLVDLSLSRFTHPRRLEKHFVFDPIPCAGDLKSVLKAFGEIHLLGHDVSVECLYDVSFPVDVTAPPISPLVRWDHTQSWLIPEWPEFFCRVKDDVEVPYSISDIETDGIHSTQGLLLYHALIAISEKHNKTHELVNGMELYDMVWTLNESSQENLLNTDTIYVQTGKKSFVIEKEGDTLLLSGKYKIYEPEEMVTLPKIPGYDLDINENLKGSNDDEDDRLFLEKTEIMWEDGWLDFLDTLLEFSTQGLEGPLLRIWISPSLHMKEVKDCANMLAVVERCSGLSKAGGVVFHTKVSQLKNRNTQRVANLEGVENSRVSLLMVYSIDSVSEENHRVLIYQGENAKEQVIGIVLITERGVEGREFPLSMGWTPKDLEQLIPYMLAVYLLLDVAKIKENNSLLILPPIDTLCVYLMALANEMEVTIFTSSYDAEVRDVIDNLFPYVRVLSGERLEQNIKTLTQGEGCDVVLQFTSADFQSAIDMTADNGKAIFCTLPTPREQISLSKECSLVVPDLSQAVTSFMRKSLEDIQLFLYNMQNGCIAEISKEGFPEVQGLKYNLAERSHFTQPVELAQILSAIEDPIVNANNQSIAEMMEADVIAMQRLQSAISTKPKDFSLLVNDCSDKENQFDSYNPLNIAQTVTPAKLSGKPSDEVRLIYLPQINLQDYDDVFDTTTDKLGIPMVTPIITITDETDAVSKVITSTPMFGFTADHTDEFTKNLLPKKTTHLAIPRLTIPSSISNYKKGAKMSLIVYSTPTTPHFSPALKSLLTPSITEPTIVPLNESRKRPALFCVHPITGKLKLLKTLGGLLQYQFCGIQRTSMTPNDSIQSVASYYKNAVQMYDQEQPYYLIGYSFGSLVAMEMAIQLQEQGSKVGCLILLDGGPAYFHSQFKQGTQAASQEEEKLVYLECGALVNFLQMYASIPNHHLIMKILLSLKTIQERIDLALDMTFGRVLVSPNPAKSKWLVAKEKMKIRGFLTPCKSYGFGDAAEEIIRLKRLEAAKDFISSVHMAYKYQRTSQKFRGDIHLLRVKSELPHSGNVPLDYGLKDWCTGNVSLRFYSGTHESFLQEEDGEAVAKDITQIIQDLC